MSEIRKIRKVFKGKPTMEGAGVHLKRVFGFPEVPAFDPFLLLDDFRSDNPDHFLKGFPWHPHRGIETITYVLKGDVQWMTVGSGIIRQEMPKGDGSGRMYGFLVDYVYICTYNISCLLNGTVGKLPPT